MSQGRGLLKMSAGHAQKVTGVKNSVSAGSKSQGRGLGNE